MSNLDRCIPRYNTKQNAKKEKKLKLAIWRKIKTDETKNNIEIKEWMIKDKYN